MGLTSAQGYNAAKILVFLKFYAAFRRHLELACTAVIFLLPSPINFNHFNEYNRRLKLSFSFSTQKSVHLSMNNMLNYNLLLYNHPTSPPSYLPHLRESPALIFAPHSPLSHFLLDPELSCRAGFRMAPCRVGPHKCEQVALKEIVSI